jgi:hypothetical protein
MHDGRLDAARKCRCVREPQIESLSREGVYDVRRISNERRSGTDICFSMSEA